MKNKFELKDEKIKILNINQMEEERNVLGSRENVIKKTLTNKIQELTRAEKEMKKMLCKIF